MFFSNNDGENLPKLQFSSKTLNIKITHTDSQLLDFFEMEVPANTPLTYVAQFACEQFQIDHTVSKKGAKYSL